MIDGKKQGRDLHGTEMSALIPYWDTIQFRPIKRYVRTAS